MNIKPTLFIGIGTSGLAMINSVRELLFEEFLFAGFPCVRFLNITSHTEGEPFKLPNEQFTNDFERINSAHINITQNDYCQVSQMLNPSNIAFYNSGLAQWLNPSLAKMGDNAIDHGMQNKRQLGRLALWLNWERVMPKVVADIQSVQSAENKTKSNSLINSYFVQKGVPTNPGQNFVSDGMNIFIVGSLLGGTGSGVLLDLAFYVRKMFESAKVYGIFTFMDDALAGSPNNAQLAANAYASLIELDYYNHNGTCYDYLIPQTNIRQSNINEPFTQVSLISTKNTKSAAIPLVRSDGTVDLENLHKMIGISMFFDTVTGTANEKQALRINWSTSHFVELPEPPRYRKIFSSFGAVALWYPKSRISGAAASIYIEKYLCKKWLGLDRGKSGALIEQKKNTFINSLKAKLRNSVSQITNDLGQSITIQQDYLQEISFLENFSTPKELDISDLKNKLINNPRENPIPYRFGINCYYHKKIMLNLELHKNLLLDTVNISIQDLLNESLQTIIQGDNFSNHLALSLSDLNAFSVELNKSIETLTANKIRYNNKPIDFEDLKDNFEALEIEQSRKLTQIIGVRPIIINQHYSRIKDGIKNILNEASDQLIESCVLEIIKKYKSDIINIITTSITPVYNKISEINSIAKATADELSQMLDYSTLKIVFTKNSMQEEIDSYVQQISQTNISGHFTQFLETIKNTTKDNKISFNEILGVIQKIILSFDSMQKFDIVNHVDNPVILNLASNAEPMFEPHQSFRSIPIPNGQNPTVIGGGANEQSRNKVKNLINSMQTDKPINNAIDIDMGHLLFVYKEEAGIAISEMKAFHSMLQHYRSGVNNFCHSDKDPNKFDIERFLKFEEMKRDGWFKISNELLSIYIYADKIINNNKTALKFVYVNEFQEDQVAYFAADDEETFINTLSNDNTLFLAFKTRYQDALKQFDTRSINNLVNSYLQSLVASGVDPLSNKYQTEEEFYNKFRRDHNGR